MAAPPQLIQCLATSFFLLLVSASPHPPPLLNRYTIRGAPFPSATNVTELIEPTLPQPLLDDVPICSLPLFQFDFDSNSSLASANYTSPDTDQCPWMRALLEISASAEGGEYSDRIGAVWLDGVELLRTSTPEPTEAGVFWKLRKDVTRYSPVLSRGGVVSMALESVVHGAVAGVYHVNATLHFYGAPLKLESWEVMSMASRKLGISSEVLKQKRSKRLHALFGMPADQIIPLSSPTGEEDEQGLWFRIQDETNIYTKMISIPRNTHRAVLEIFVSGHADDEFWYSNPPNYFYEQNHLPVKRGNGPIRQLSVTVDGFLVSSTVPFPTIYSGGVNPLFWTPVAPIASFDLRSHDIELTPILGHLLDGEQHEFALGITEALPFWLVGANLHLWLDPNSTVVSAQVIKYKAPGFASSIKSKSSPWQWEFQAQTEGELRLSGWVASSLGNLTTHVKEEFEAGSKIAFKSSGEVEEVEFEVESKREVKVLEGEKKVLTKMTHKVKLPLEISVKVAVEGNSTYRSSVKVSRGLEEKVTTVNYGAVGRRSEVRNEQEGEGWMVFEEGGAVISGSVGTVHKYSSVGGRGCYERTLKVRNGVVGIDRVSNLCSFEM